MIIWGVVMCGKAMCDVVVVLVMCGVGGGGDVTEGDDKCYLK